MKTVIIKSTRIRHDHNGKPYWVLWIGSRCKRIYLES